MMFSKKQKQPQRRRSYERTPTPAETNPFRRGRTLTGSTSLSSAAETKAQLKSPRAQVHELAAKRRHISGLLVLALLISAGLYGLVSQFTATVTIRATDGVSLASSDVYEVAIQEYLMQNPAQRLRFLLDTKALDKFVQSKTSEVGEVQLNGSDGFGVSAFQMTMREPIVAWKIDGREQFVDDMGAAFEKNYFKTPNVKVVDQSGVPIETGRAVASNRFLGFLGLTVGLVKTYGYNVHEITLPRDTTHQVEMKLKDVAYPIKLSIDRPAGEQIEDMARAVKWLHDAGKAPKYVDVRVSGKAFYKE
jgi:hypothetical protein